MRPWAKSIKEKVLLREMPPWPADPNESVKFRNDARLNQRDIDTLVAWINAGCPRGSSADSAPIPHLTQEWLHPDGVPPDAIIALPGLVQVPPQGEIPYVRFLPPVPFSGDKWVVASQVMPGNGAVVHHMAITELGLANWQDLDALKLLSQQMQIANDITPTQPAVTVPGKPDAPDVLGVYTPGSGFEMYPEGTAKLLKGGGGLYLNFNIHYTTTGKPEQDRSRIGLWFGPGPPRHQLYRVPGAVDTILAGGKELFTDTPGEKAEGTSVSIPPIPPYATNYEVIGMSAFLDPVIIYQFQPHAHLRGKDFRYLVIYPDGREQTVLSVPKYGFNWQLAYDLEAPLELPAGSKLVVIAHYDNSSNNKNNPSPQSEVHFRDENQSWDEMFTPFIQYSIGNDAPALAGRPAPVRRGVPTVVELAQVDGCLEQTRAGEWWLTKASAPLVSAAQSTTSTASVSIAGNPLGTRRYKLIGSRFFHPERLADKASSPKVPY